MIRTAWRAGWKGLAAAALLTGALGPADVAKATPVLELRVDGGVAPITAVPGQTLSFEIRLGSGPEGISAYGVSLGFDEEGSNAFDVVSAEELLPAGFVFNLTSGVEAIEESGPGVPGSVKTCEAATFGAGPAGATFAACRVQLRVTGALGSFAIQIGLLNPGIDGLFDNQGTDISGALGPAVAIVTVVPEPGSLALLLLGCLGLAGARGIATP